MKKLLILLLTMVSAFAVLRAQSLVDAEYYFDTDPGVGSGVPVTMTGGDSVTVMTTIDGSALAPGFHNLFIRVRDDLGRWSLVKRHLFYVYDDTPVDLRVTQPDLEGFEYFFDQDQGAGSGTWVSSTPGEDLSQPVNFPTAGLDPGFHRLMVRPRDVNGKWGQYSTHLFYLFEDTHMDLSRIRSGIARAEYFFDKDTVGQGNGVALEITPGNEVEWSGGIPVGGLESGDHMLFIRVQDSTGVWSIVYAKAFSVVGLSSTTNSPICQGADDGTATVEITGGKAPYTYLWDDPEQQSGQTATGLRAGSYIVTVTDAEGAVLRETVEITEFDTIRIGISTSDTDCKLAQGSATALASGDNPPFKYLWTNGSDEASASGLSSGIYEVTVTDNAGCQNKAVATINDIGGPEISTDGRIENLKCAGDNDGIIDPQVTGGTPPYAYSWSNGETTKGIQGLQAGNYELTVTDAQGCIANTSVRVESPPPITFSLSVTESDCGVQNGAATLNVKGGTTPYAYNWTGFSAPHNATRTGLGAGVYEVTVTDNESCIARAQVAVGEKGAPSINVTSVSQSSCGQTDGVIQIAVAGGSGSYTYQWRNGAGTQVGASKNLTGVGPGAYNVLVSDGSGCKAFATAAILAEQPPVDPICLVTVDTITGKDMIVWNKTPGQGIVAYRLYRETSSAGVFDSIAYIPVDSLSRFSDSYADPTIRSWRYRLAAVNACGVESRLSPPHKTMHLSISLGLLGRINLLWNNYEGYVPKDGSYKIWRFTSGLGWEMIAKQAVETPINTFTDANPPDADLWYYIEAEHPTGCTPLKAATLNSSRSNRINKLKEAPEAVRSFVDAYNLVVYPNPSEGKFRILMETGHPENIDIRVFDLSGKLVYIYTIKNFSGQLSHEVDLSGIAEGMYQMQIRTGSGVYNNKLVIR